jgi:hypothetical protein
VKLLQHKVQTVAFRHRRTVFSVFPSFLNMPNVRAGSTWRLSTSAKTAPKQSSQSDDDSDSAEDESEDDDPSCEQEHEEEEEEGSDDCSPSDRVEHFYRTYKVYKKL